MIDGGVHMPRLYIVGAGEFGREVLQYVRDVRDRTIEIVGFLDDDLRALDGYARGTRIVGPVGGHEPQRGDLYVVAVGEPRTRRRFADALGARGAAFFTIVHPTAYVAAAARLEAGCIVGPFAFVGDGATIASHAVLNTYASAGHDSTVGACSVLSPYAVVNGRVVLEDDVFLGTHATVVPRRRVGTRSKVAAAAVVTRDVPPHALAAGNPARSRVLYGP